MLEFSLIFGCVFLSFIAWFITSARRIKRRGEAAIDCVRVKNMDMLEAIVLSTERPRNELASAKRLLWLHLGGFRGLLDLHHDAACKIESMQAVAERKGYGDGLDLEVRGAYYSLGIIVLSAAVVLCITWMLERFGRGVAEFVPSYVEDAIRLSAIISARHDTIIDLPNKAV